MQNVSLFSTAYASELSESVNIIVGSVLVALVDPQKVVFVAADMRTDRSLM